MSENFKKGNFKNNVIVSTTKNKCLRSLKKGDFIKNCTTERFVMKQSSKNNNAFITSNK